MAWFECTGGSNGSSGITLPVMVSSQSVSRYASATPSISYTFTDAGKYQYYAVIKTGDVAPSTSELTIKINDTVITPTTGFFGGTAYLLFYGEVIVSANDVISIVSVQSQHSGLQLHVFKNADISAFSWLGNVPNNGTTFNIVNDGISLEVYYQGYWYSANRCSSHLIAGDAVCIPSPTNSDYYYGGTYAIKVL